MNNIPKITSTEKDSIYKYTIDSLYNNEIKKYLVEKSKFPNWVKLKNSFIEYNTEHNISSEEALKWFREYIISKCPISQLLEATSLFGQILVYQIAGLNILIVPDFLWDISFQNLEAAQYSNFFKTQDFIILPNNSLRHKKIDLKTLLEHEIFHSLQDFIDREKHTLNNGDFIYKVLKRFEFATLQFVQDSENTFNVEKPFKNEDIQSFIKEFEAYFLHLDLSSKQFMTSKSGFEHDLLYDLGALINKNIYTMYQKGKIPKSTKYLILNLMKNLYNLVPKLTDQNRFEIMHKINRCKNLNEINILFEELNLDKSGI